MISDPLCLFDYTMESDGAVAVITTSAERARDLRQPPVYILASANGGTGRWGPAIFRYFQAPDDVVRLVGPPTGGQAALRDGRGGARPTSTSPCSTTTSPRW